MAVEDAGEAIVALVGATDLAAVQRVVRTAARHLVGADGATFVLRDAEHCFYADEDAVSPLWKGQRFPLTNCISGWSMIHAQQVVVPDVFDDPRVPQEAYRPTFVKSLAMTPVGGGRPVAAIGAYWATHHTATADELAGLKRLAKATAAALRRLGVPPGSEPAAPGPSPVAEAPAPDPGRQSAQEALRPPHPEAPSHGVGLPSGEREQIARDLHDTILQRLFGAGLRLQRLSDTVEEASATSEIDEVIGQIDETIRELRGVIYGLEYGHRLGGLHGAILAVAAESSRVLGFKPRLLLDSTLDAVDDDLRREVVGALREMLSNVARHARATAVTVECVGGAGVRLQVTDDGMGIADDAVRGNGLGNLEARAAALGGTFTVRPAPGGGTVATFSIPVAVGADPVTVGS